MVEVVSETPGATCVAPAPSHLSCLRFRSPRSVRRFQSQDLGLAVSGVRVELSELRVEVVGLRVKGSR